MVCIVFMEATHTKFIPDCIKSNFLHTFIVVQVDPNKEPNKYTVSTYPLIEQSSCRVNWERVKSNGGTQVEREESTLSLRTLRQPHLIKKGYRAMTFLLQRHNAMKWKEK